MIGNAGEHDTITLLVPGNQERDFPSLRFCDRVASAGRAAISLECRNRGGLLRRRYVLGFRPEKLSGKRRHDVRIEVTRPDLIVRARKTYFQDPQRDPQ